MDSKNVNDLFSDMKIYRAQSAYRLGSVVFHEHLVEDEIHLDIVDGQQRSLTLLLIILALIEERISTLKRQNLKNNLLELQPIINDFVERQRFTSDISYQNLHQNFLAAKRIVMRHDFLEDDIDFLLNRCELVVFVLNDVSEAFQFFDSQNARGRDLEPHDLLKAYHLREFIEEESYLKAQSVAHWEGLQSDDLANLFAKYLYRIRRWAQGKSARFFGKNQISIFKGVNINRVSHYPYVESLRIAHYFVDDYNNQYQRNIDNQLMNFPFHLDQMIINGRRFFDMAKHYYQQVAAIVGSEYDTNKNTAYINGIELDLLASKIIYTLNTYASRTRTGDRYVRIVFDCAVIFYMDKFGSERLSEAIEKLFIWAYTCRIRQQVVQMATIDNYVISNNIFSLMKNSVIPNELFAWSQETLKESEKRDTKGNELIQLFKEMKYYE